MSNALYDAGRQKFLEGGIAWLTDTIKIILIDTASYTVNLATHQFLSDIAVGAIIGTAQTLASKTSTAGVANAANPTFVAVPNTSVEALVIYKYTGTNSTSPLIAFIDTATGLPFQINGGSVQIVFDPSLHIFKL